MSATFDANPRPGAAWLPWLPVALGLAALYVPVFNESSLGHWQSDDHAHGPIILAVIAWLFWRQKHALLGVSRGNAPAGIAHGCSGQELIDDIRLGNVRHAAEVSIDTPGARRPRPPDQAQAVKPALERSNCPVAAETAPWRFGFAALRKL